MSEKKVLVILAKGQDEIILKPLVIDSSVVTYPCIPIVRLTLTCSLPGNLQNIHL